MSGSLLSRLQALADAATNEIDRLVYRAKWAGAMARMGQIDRARSEVSSLRAVNTSYHPLPTGWILIAEGLADHYESLSASALDKFKRAHGLAIAFSDDDLASFASAWMGASDWLAGDYDSAVSHALEAIRKAPPTAAVALSRAHSILANILYAIGAYLDAALEYAVARQFAIEAHDISMQSTILYNVAAFHIARLSLEDAFGLPTDHDVGLAELELNSVANLDTGIGVSSLSELVPLLRAQLLLVKKQWSEANAQYDQALPKSAIYGSSRWESRFLAEQSHCHAMLGWPTSAAELASKAIAQVHEHIEVDDLAACHARLSLSLSASGDRATADKHFSVAKQHLAQFKERQSMRRATLGQKILAIVGSKD